MALVHESMALAVDFLMYEYTPEIPSVASVSVGGHKKVYAITYDTRLTRGLYKNENGGSVDLTEIRAFRNRCAISGVGFTQRPMPYVNRPNNPIKTPTDPAVTVIDAGASCAYTRAPGPGLVLLTTGVIPREIEKKLGPLIEEDRFYNKVVHGRSID